MKLLIQNYSSPLTTEPFYFTECAKRGGADSILWADNKISAFDMFDTVNPDVFVGHFAYLTEDIIKYLSQNKSIKPLINISATNEQQLRGIIDAFNMAGLENQQFFTNDFYHPHGERVEVILPSVDLFIQPQVPQFNIPHAVISDSKDETVDKFIQDKEVYHLVSYGKKEQWADYFTDIRNFWSLSKSYDEVTLIDDGTISTTQFFFQATMLCNKLNIISKSDEQRETFQQMISSVFTSEETSEPIADVVKKQMIKNHTCFNRTSQLLKLLGMEKEASSLLEIIK